MSYQKNTGAVRRYARLMKFANWLQSLPARLTPAPFRLMQISSAFWQSRVVYVAARLDIATVLGDAALTTDEIAARVGADAAAIGRLLRMLAAMGIFQRVAGQQYRNNKGSAPLRTDDPQSIRAMVLMHNSDVMSRPWFEQLEAGVRSGTPPFELSHGEEMFAWMERHVDFNTLFAQAMDSVEALTGDSFATDFDWARFGRLIDVGGSKGAKAMAILKRHPHLRAVVVDRPLVIGHAGRYWAGRVPDALLARMQFQVGDVLEAVPAAEGPQDIYFLSAVFHGFDDATVLQGLRTLAAACGSSGARIAILEFVLPELADDLVGATFDMQMFMATRGRERTLSEWGALFAAAGLQLEEVVALQSFGNIMVLQHAAAAPETH